MLQEIELYLEKYPEGIALQFKKIRDIILSITDITVEEKMWAKLPSYYCGEKFIRIIPFKDHINIEASGLAEHMSDFPDCKFTPKGMLQIKANQELDSEMLRAAFSDTYM